MGTGTGNAALNEARNVVRDETQNQAQEEARNKAQNQAQDEARDKVQNVARDEMQNGIQGQDIEEILASGRAVQIKPQGYSMYPVIVPGRDEVIVQKEDPARLRRGDVALYRRDGSILVIHRIVRKNEKGYYMAGDNQTEMEGPLRPDQIRGKMVALIRNGKEIDVRSLSYRIPCSIWLAMRPVRRPVSLAVAAIKRLCKKHS